MNVMDTSSSRPPPMAFADVPDPAPGPTTSSGIATAGTISESDIHSLLAYFWSFNPSTTPRDAPDLVHIHTVVTRLFAKDYDIALVDNDWCSSYPHQLIIPTRQRHPVNPGSSAALVNNPTTLVPLFRNSRFSRVRSRFVVPVLLLNGRNICRSSTLSNEAEVQLNSIAEKAKYFKRQLFSSASAMTADLPGAAAGRPRSPASPPPPPPIPGSTTSSATSQPSSDTDDPVKPHLHCPPWNASDSQTLPSFALCK
ncbi:hypothetical protein BCR44DRAFT_1216636 [Catenaria anguillulae PL171]|uniref:Uncharacterized protein n=1 Tax=Catenaria anguillulae PL171 TaxID=765915 RepID=A0A1Y2HZ12_9FUNG|nr:hypothetical protein BCR44DRAFT_1216636 [Catenaria anguillulae PL171]